MSVSVLDRFWPKVDRSGECWTWLGARTRLGYGQFRHEGRVAYAHRVAYELLRGPIPTGLVLDHLCRNTSCVNPAHLEPVTNRENILRGTGPSANQARQTSCSKGHPLDGDNVVWSASNKRRCRTCRKAWDRARRAKKRDALVCEQIERAEGWVS